MRTSLNKLKIIEKYLQQELNPADKLLLDAQLLLDKDLQDNFYWQQKSYQLIRFYGREKLRKKLLTVEQELFVNPVHQNFMDKIKAFFTK